MDTAVEIATRAHAGQVDKTGTTPYIRYPLAVAARVQGHDAKIVAILHDVLEDTSVTIDELRAAGATEAQLRALVAVTRKPDEPYLDAVARAIADPIGCLVKIADHEDNNDEARLVKLPPGEANRLRRKYAEVAPLIEHARRSARGPG
ncbi:MAG: guanosine-3',5'-bis(diphosphate) 3'-pyrophosphohydrolase [Chloroflexota bacterium]|nr:guanosine-3',5'-bis(diphosphate) 3'-pyrophosphohydrolase [Chloroflexota bacterium]